MMTFDPPKKNELMVQLCKVMLIDGRRPILSIAAGAAEAPRMERFISQPFIFDMLIVSGGAKPSRAGETKPRECLI